MKKSAPKIGVLALQGAFRLHQFHIEECGAEYVEVVNNEDFKFIDALIIPGGESSVMLKLIESTGIEDRLVEFFSEKPIWGICAGAILMAKSVNNPTQKSFGVMDIDITRNAYGRQLESTFEEIDGYMVSYIRAPKINRVGLGIKVLSERNGAPTCVESDRQMVTTFHPEMNLNFGGSPWHERLIRKI
jgi:5'-phosphate synthase pdxT subunit